MNTHRRWPLASAWCGNSCAASRFFFCCTYCGAAGDYSCFNHTTHTQSKYKLSEAPLPFGFSRTWHQSRFTQCSPACYHTLSLSHCFSFSFLKFTGCFWVVFFRRVLSKHWRCLGLWLLSGCEVFVTVAKPTPSVMARQSMSVHVYTRSLTHSRDGLEYDWLYGCWQRCLGDVDCRHLTLQRCHRLQPDKRQTAAD